MTPKGWFVIAAAGLGIYLLRKEALATSAIIDKATAAATPMNGLGVVSSVPALQARLVSGAQRVQDIQDMPLNLPPPPPGIPSWRAR